MPTLHKQEFNHERSLLRQATVYIPMQVVPMGEMYIQSFPIFRRGNVVVDGLDYLIPLTQLKGVRYCTPHKSTTFSSTCYILSDKSSI